MGDMYYQAWKHTQEQLDALVAASRDAREYLLRRVHKLPEDHEFRLDVEYILGDAPEMVRSGMPTVKGILDRLDALGEG